MRFIVAPTLDELMDSLSSKGWSIGDVSADGQWLVHCTNGDQIICAKHSDRTRAWEMAVEQARLLRKVPSKNN